MLISNGTKEPLVAIPAQVEEPLGVEVQFKQVDLGKWKMSDFTASPFPPMDGGTIDTQIPMTFLLSLHHTW